MNILDNIDILEKVRVLLQKVSEVAREHSRKQIEELVTSCLQYIFGSDIRFEIELMEARGRIEAEFFVLSDIGGNIVKTRPQEARGGGVVDIISLALRFAMLQSSSPHIGGPVIMDEPAKHVSDDFIIQVGDFIKQAGIMLDRQVLIVTHKRYLAEIAD